MPLPPGVLNIDGSHVKGDLKQLTPRRFFETATPRVEGNVKRKVVLVIAVAFGVIGLAPALAHATPAPPTPVGAFYVYGADTSDLQWGCYDDGYTFAQNTTTGYQPMILDFGQPMYESGNYGCYDFSGQFFSNTNILTALEDAADGIHNGATSTGPFYTVVYGNSNYGLNSLTTTQAYNVGYDQAAVAEDLANYDATVGYAYQSACAGSDMEPAWASATKTKELIDGDWAQNWALYLDYGSAEPGYWATSDIGYVSFYGLAEPLPEVYYTADAADWTAVRKNWNANHTVQYCFCGVTSETGAGLTPAQAWSLLYSQNPNDVGSDLVDFNLWP